MEGYDDPEFTRVNYWVEQFEKTLNEQVDLQTAAHPEVEPQMVREAFVIKKLAVLTVANEILGERIRTLEAKLNK